MFVEANAYEVRCYVLFLLSCTNSSQQRNWQRKTRRTRKKHIWYTLFILVVCSGKVSCLLFVKQVVVVSTDARLHAVLFSLLYSSHSFYFFSTWNERHTKTHSFRFLHPWVKRRRRRFQANKISKRDAIHHQRFSLSSKRKSTMRQQCCFAGKRNQEGIPSK